MGLNIEQWTCFVFDRYFASVSYGNGVMYNYWRREEEEQEQDGWPPDDYEIDACPPRIGLRKSILLTGIDPDLKNRSAPLGSWKYQRRARRQWRERELSSKGGRNIAQAVKCGVRKRSLSTYLVVRMRWAEEAGLNVGYHDLAKRSWREREKLLREARELQTAEEAKKLEQKLKLESDSEKRAELRQEIAWKKSCSLVKIRSSFYKKKKKNEAERKRKEMLLLQEHSRTRRYVY